MTDMNCAWYTHYTYIDIDTKTIHNVNVCSGCGEGLKDVEIVPMTDEIKAMYKDALAKMVDERAKKVYDNFIAECDKYNASKRVQTKGQVVEITEGKYKGIKGRVTWIGESMYGKPHRTNMNWRAVAVMYAANARPFDIPNENANLVLVRPLVWGDTFANGMDKVYVSIDKCKVVEGFTPITFSLDDCKSYIKNTESIFEGLRSGYDYHSNV